MGLENTKEKGTKNSDEAEREVMEEDIADTILTGSGAAVSETEP